MEGLTFKIRAYIIALYSKFNYDYEIECMCAFIYIKMHPVTPTTKRASTTTTDVYKRNKSEQLVEEQGGRS